MTIDEMRRERQQCELAIANVLEQFTKVTGCHIDGMDLNVIDVTTFVSKNPDELYSVKITVVL